MLDSKMREKVKKWTSFYRQNPHRFAEDYLGLRLKTFQKILLYLIFKYPMFTFLASRGLGKSWLIAVVSIIKCILYPGTLVTLASGTRGQAEKIIITKIQTELNLNFPNINREILKFTTGSKETAVYFKNGSKITAVTANDNARGERCSLLIVDEHRLMKKSIYDSVLKPFLTYTRQPGFLSNPKYKDYKELDNQIIFMSSAWYKNHWIYEFAEQSINKMLDGREDEFITAIPYQLGIKEKIINPTQIKLTMNEVNFDRISFDMEYMCQFFGESNGALLKLNDFEKNRRLYNAYIPRSTSKLFEDVYKYGKYKNKEFPKASDQEIRVISIDVSIMAGQQNDNTILSFLRLLPNKNGTYYDLQLSNSIAIHGLHSDIQAMMIKRYFYDFSADYIVMDVNGNGVSVYDSLAKVSYDNETSIEYPAFGSFNKEEYEERMLLNEEDEDTKSLVIFAINPSSEVNHIMAMKLKSKLEKGHLSLLVDTNIALADMYKNKDYKLMSIEEEAEAVKPFASTTMLINESIGLEMQQSQGRFIKLVEVGMARKDRYSSLAYGVYFANLLESELEVEEEKYTVQLKSTSIGRG